MKGILFLTVLLAAADVFARAGGGGGYAGGGGGGGGGGFSGGGGGNGFAIYLVFRLIEFWIVFCVNYPIIGIPLTLVILAIVFYGVKTGAGGAVVYHQASTIRQGRRLQDVGARERAVAHLKQRDTAFDPDILRQRITQAFTRVQTAWSNQNLDTVRAFVSDGIFERFSLQIQEQQERGVRNRMEQVSVLSVEIAQLTSDDFFDTLTVAIDASAIDYEEDLKTGKPRTPRGTPEAFREYWSFIRRPGTESLRGNGLIEGNCPNCGAALNLNEAAVCTSCGALVRSGQYDWVLAEITQACEWRAEEPVEIPGVKELRSRDPGFSVQHLEDRASVMFWRLMASLRKGKVNAIRKMAADSFCTELENDLKPDADGTRRYPVECAVGTVKTLAVVAAEPNDVALVEIRWSAGLVEQDAKGRLQQTAAAAVKTDVYVLARRHGTVTDVGRALSSAHCPGCGAPEHDGNSHACEYCGAVLNDGTSDWVLQMRRPPYDPEIEQWRKEAQTGLQAAGASVAPGSLELAAWMVAVMLADQRIDDEERELLRQYGAKRNIPETRMAQLIRAVENGQMQSPEPRDRQQAGDWLEEMAAMAVADGFVDDREKRALKTLATRLGMTDVDIQQVLARKRRETYQKARVHVRLARQAAKSK